MNWFTGLSQDAQDSTASSDEALRREQYFFTLYRLLVASLFTLLVFGPLSEEWITLRHPTLASTTSVTYLIMSVLLFLHARRLSQALFGQVVIGVMLDILVTVLMVHSVSHLQTGIAMMLIINFGAAAVLLPLRPTLMLALTAGILLVSQYLFSRMGEGLDHRSLVEILVCALGYLAMAKLGDMVGRQMRESHVLVQQREVEAASLAQINELVIRRMRTGVLVVDVVGVVHLHNEAAWHLLGQPDIQQLSLSDHAPELAQRLFQWRMGNERNLDKPLQLHGDSPEIIPRFSGLGVHNELFVIFLDDTSLVSRRAEELTLSNLGRLSASIAHEIRNPLAAISHSAQLLEESPDLPEPDKRLVEIVLNHCQRMNGIIDNILSLSRRERSRPETVNISVWVSRFVDEYQGNHYLENNQLRATVPSEPLLVVVDPQQLEQVVSSLVQNAIIHGHLPGEPARITVAARRIPETAAIVIEVLDRGPGIPVKTVERIFEPFITTHEHGTGLGLYIARQLCEANQAKLEYVPMAGGSCFRISLTVAQRLEGISGLRKKNG